MRYLLLIPALTLFLSYIPFVRKMDMKEMMIGMKKSGCCKKKQETQACHKTDDAGAGNKCAKQDAGCVCICGFQYAAPAQITVKLLFGIDIAQLEPAGYIQQHWKDAQRSAPWQPPDVS